MLPIEGIPSDHAHAATRSMGFAQPPMMPVMTQPQEELPSAINKSGCAENGTCSDREQKGLFGEKQTAPAKIFLSAQAKEAQAATYSPASLNSTKKSGPAHDEDDADFIRRLKERDQEVRNHEMTHAAALGPYAGAIQYTYQVGPDGRAYAVGGSIAVNMSRESNAAADFFKSETIKRAAVAAGDPSDADMAVAAKAAQQAQNAAQQLG